ncbi:hypothetical protein V1477_013034 [Vespula maculifrons]|uniref:Uncharacterized protein n=1 Tax=Vespula maculifrons TaxID=7453 RepID=A0ABD2BVA7_VESMC
MIDRHRYTHKVLVYCNIMAITRIANVVRRDTCCIKILQNACHVSFRYYIVSEGEGTIGSVHLLQIESLTSTIEESHKTD